MSLESKDCIHHSLYFVNLILVVSTFPLFPAPRTPWPRQQTTVGSVSHGQARMKHLNLDSLRRKVNLSKLNLSLVRKRSKPDGIKANRRLPPGKAINSLGDHLYTHGIILFPPESNAEVKRKSYYHPCFIAFLELLYFIRSCLSLLVPESNRDYFARAGDYMFFVGDKTHINLAATQFMLIGMSIVTLNYLRYCRNQRPDFFDVYDMLAGKISPRKAGLHEGGHIGSLLRRSRALVTLTDYNTRLVCLICLPMSLVPIIIKCTTQEALLYGLPWSLLFAIAGYHTISCYYWNMTYFYILCHFIKFRLREACHRARRAMSVSISSRKRSQFVLEKQFTTIADQVRRYNRSYWATVLFLIVFFLTTFNNSVLYATLFVEMNLVTKGSLYYAAVVNPLVTFFLLNTASVVHHESGVSRRVLSKLHANLHRTLGFRASFKLSLMIEALSKKVIGFHFLTLFIINYARFFEITCMTMAYFLKIIQLSR